MDKQWKINNPQTFVPGTITDIEDNMVTIGCFLPHDHIYITIEKQYIPVELCYYGAMLWIHCIDADQPIFEQRIAPYTEQNKHLLQQIKHHVEQITNE